MAGRIPMVGDPKPLDTEERKAELTNSILRMRDDGLRMLSEAEATGDRKEIVEAGKILKRVQKLIDDYGLE